MNKNLKKMNLLIIAPHFLTFIKDQTIEISSNFNKVYVIIFYPITSPFRLFTKSLSDISRIDISNIPKNIIIIKVPYFILPGSFFFFLRGILGFKLINHIIRVRKIKFNMIHCHFLWPCGYIGYRIKTSFNKPLVLTGHGYDVYEIPFRSKNWKKRITNVLANTDAIITVSKKNKNYLLKLITKEIKIIPNGYDQKRFKSFSINKKKLNISEKNKILLSVGNIEKIKGHIYLVHAIKEVIKKRSDITCYIIGGGEEFNNIKREIKKLKLEKYIILVGVKPHNEIPFWMNACDIYIQPSINEGVPTVIFEAIACGKPVIGTDVGGIPEIINKKNGILVKEKNSKQLANAIEIALEKKWDIEYILEYSKQFSWKKIAKQIVELYYEV